MSPSPHFLDPLSFLTGDSASYIDQLYTAYLKDPKSVSEEWRTYFASLKTTPPPKTAPLQEDPATLKASLDAAKMMQAYRTLGHKLAQLDPLGLTSPNIPPELSSTPKDETRDVLVEEKGRVLLTTFRDLKARFNRIYGGTIGLEFAHIEDPTQRLWLQNQMEGEQDKLPLSECSLNPEEKKQLLHKLLKTEVFEQFLHKKYPGATRFGLDGAESLIPAIEEVLACSVNEGVEEVVIGMPHRGRLNVLTNILEKSTKAIFAEFQGGEFYVSSLEESGDVKYHLGASADRIFHGKKVHLSLMPNPSHLEAVDPVVLGKVRAHQAECQDVTRSKIMGLLLHGDAAFAGQGIVAETFMLSHLKGYETGGTLHIVVNNQIGFTTSPTDGRSSPYCSDLALAIQAPVFHVNGDDPEAVIKVAHLASLYRHTFKFDVVIDLVCYRRFGHNEGDEPGFTQPLMVKKIAQLPSVATLYAQKLIEAQTVTPEDVAEYRQKIQDTLQKDFKDAATYTPPPGDQLGGRWQGYSFKTAQGKEDPTGVAKESLLSLGKALTQVPGNFHLHPKLERFLASRRTMIEGAEPIDWSMAEALAFASLLTEGHPVRLSGQDSGRGTFSQRHAVLKDQGTEESYVPLNHLAPSQASFEVWDSPLAEASILGFEVGYSFADPKALVVWEAQYGDFSNGAQVIIDQFLASAESKWLRMSGLVLLLPHAYEGQGPEHSSARLERYLQLCAEDNLQVVNCTTPANYFHVLRRQIHRSYRKPLIVMTPKSFLRKKEATSPLEEFEKGKSFQKVIPDSLPKVSRVILCSGKFYYDLVEARERNTITDIALIRLEQLYPFPHDEVVKALSPFKKAEVMWAQEEPLNMGAWTFLDRRLERALKDAKMEAQRPLFLGREAAASPATGLSERHAREQNTLLKEALNLK